MRILLATLIMTVVIGVVPTVAQAPQSTGSFSFELRGEVAAPTGEFADRFDLDPGFGIGAAVKLPIAAPLVLYAGWDRFRFNGTPGELGVQVIDQGFRAGAQLIFPRRVTPFVTAGAIFNRASLAVRDTLGTTRFSGESSTGYEVGGGLRFPVLRGVWLVPEARYRSHAGSWDTVVIPDPDVRITYLAFNLGVVIQLPRPAPGDASGAALAASPPRQSR